MDELKPCPGSSPRTRGAPSPKTATDAPRQDHPRVRGEHHRPIRRHEHVVGIIPAYAGSTTSRNSPKSLNPGSSPRTRGARLRAVAPPDATRDHPRVRGEHSARLAIRSIACGIIPAYAGSTDGRVALRFWDTGSSPRTRGARPPPPRPRAGCRDHPRVRGEHLTVVAPDVLDDGIIPAYAGSTFYRPFDDDTWRGSSPRTRGALRCRRPP